MTAHSLTFSFPNLALAVPRTLVRDRPLAPDLAPLTATDAELVTRYLTGDPHAFAALVRRYTDSIYNLNYRYTNDAAEAENLTQETFLRVWHALPRIALDKPLKPYLMRVALNLCRDWSDKQRIRPQELLADDETVPAAAPDPSDTVGDRELLAQVRAKLDELPPIYRAVITLRYTEDLSYEEMAAALDLPLNTVRTHLRRARAKLREMMEAE